MSWDDVIDIIYDGSERDILSLRCPECGTALEIQYSESTQTLQVICSGCCTLIKESGTRIDINNLGKAVRPLN